MAFLAATTATSQAADVAGQFAASTMSGLANQIAELADNVRVNSSIAKRIAHHVNEMVGAIASARDAGMVETGSEHAMRSFEERLNETSRTLQTFAGRSFISQLITQRRDKDALVAESDNVRAAFQAILLQIRVSAGALASDLESRLTSLSLNADLHLEELSDVNSSVRLPPQPRLHFGREQETAIVLGAVTGVTPGRVAILGGPGMGKTTLALAVLHDHEVVAHYGKSRFFIPCDGAAGHAHALATLISGAFGVISAELGALRQTVQRHIGSIPALLVLDNFESAWEGEDQRLHAENVLQILDEAPRLTVLITLRGTERPGGMRWTRPFLPPLSPLSGNAAAQAFMSIAQVPDNQSATAVALLDRLDHIPLAVTLIANLAQTESIDSLFRRWTEEETALLVRGTGDGRLSSLGFSIRMSLHSPRMRAVPAAQILLSLLALLPNGAIETDIHLWGIDHSAQGLSALLQNALVSRADARRVHVLAPIRDFMLSQHPPGREDAAPLFDHYLNMVDMAVPRSQSLTLDATLFPVLEPELRNIECIVRYMLLKGPRRQAINAIVYLAIIWNETGWGSAPDFVQEAQATAVSEGLDLLSADLLFQQARMSFNAPVPGSPALLFARARAIYERLGHERGTTDCRLALCQWLPAPMALEEARSIFSMAERNGDVRLQAHASRWIAMGLQRLRKPVEAIAACEAAISILRPSLGGKPDRFIASSVARIAEISWQLGDLSAVTRFYKEALELHEAVQNANGAHIVCTQLADTFLVIGRPLEAIVYAERALAMRTAAVFRSYVHCVLLLSAAHALAGHESDAVAAMGTVLQLRSPTGFDKHEEWRIWYTRGFLCLLRGNYADARALMTIARSKARALIFGIKTAETMLTGEGILMHALGEVEAADGNADEAAVLAIYSAVVFRRSASFATINALLLLAEVVDDDYAERLLAAVMLPAQRIGLANELAVALLRGAIISDRRGDKELARHRALQAQRLFGDIKDERRLRVLTKILG